MAVRRMNITLPEDVVKLLKKKTKPGEMSAYIAEAVRQFERKKSTQDLMRELVDGYRSRAKDPQNSEWDSTLMDGLKDED